MPIPAITDCYVPLLLHLEAQSKNTGLIYSCDVRKCANALADYFKLSSQERREFMDEGAGRKSMERTAEVIRDLKNPFRRKRSAQLADHEKFLDGSDGYARLTKLAQRLIIFLEEIDPKYVEAVRERLADNTDIIPSHFGVDIDWFKGFAEEYYEVEQSKVSSAK